MEYDNFGIPIAEAPPFPLWIGGAVFYACSIALTLLAIDGINQIYNLAGWVGHGGGDSSQCEVCFSALRGGFDDIQFILL